MTYVEQPVDVLKIPVELQGLRLLVRSLHHFKPEQVMTFLREAHQHRIPIVVFESTDRRLVRTLMQWPMSILWMLLLLPRIVGVFSWRGMLWVLPATFALTWDAFISCLRSYTLPELASMTETLNGYRWSMGFLPTAIPGARIAYLTGAPKATFSVATDRLAANCG